MQIYTAAFYIRTDLFLPTDGFAFNLVKRYSPDIHSITECRLGCRLGYRVEVEPGILSGRELPEILEALAARLAEEMDCPEEVGDYA